MELKATMLSQEDFINSLKMEYEQLQMELSRVTKEALHAREESTRLDSWHQSSFIFLPVFCNLDILSSSRLRLMHTFEYEFVFVFFHRK